MRVLYEITVYLLKNIMCNELLCRDMRKRCKFLKKKLFIPETNFKEIRYF